MIGKMSREEHELVNEGGVPVSGIMSTGSGNIGMRYAEVKQLAV